MTRIRPPSRVKTCDFDPKQPCKFCGRVGYSRIIKKPSPIMKINWRIPTSTCKSENLVYLCGCTKCGDTYIGQTGGPLKDRGNRHAHKDTDDPTKISQSWTEPRKHFCKPGHEKGFWMAPLKLLKEGAQADDREHVEATFISKFNPVLNKELPAKLSTRRKAAMNSTSKSRNPSLVHKILADQAQARDLNSPTIMYIFSTSFARGFPVRFLRQLVDCCHIWRVLGTFGNPSRNKGHSKYVHVRSYFTSCHWG